MCVYVYTHTYDKNHFWLCAHTIEWSEIWRIIGVITVLKDEMPMENFWIAWALEHQTDDGSLLLCELPSKYLWK